jgi:hypothetical protein
MRGDRFRKEVGQTSLGKTTGVHVATIITVTIKEGILVFKITIAVSITHLANPSIIPTTTHRSTTATVAHVPAPRPRLASSEPQVFS